VVRVARPYAYSGEIATAAYLLAAPTTCRFFISDEEFWDLQVFPGGASAYDQCTYNNWRSLSGSPITVPGVQAAFTFAPQPSDLGGETCATDGKSTINVWRSLSYSAEPSDYPWDTKAGVTLGSVLKAVFAAAIPSTSSLTHFVTGTTPIVTASPVTNGGCEGLFDPGTLTTLTGGNFDFDHVEPRDPLLAAVGGISCRYVAQEADSDRASYYTLVSVSPSSIVNADERAASLVTAHCPTEAELKANRNQRCYTVGEIAGWWYSVDFGSFGVAEGPQATFTTIIASLEHVLASAEAPDRVGAPRPFDCEETSIAGQSFTSWRTANGERVRRWIQPGLGDDLDPVSAAAYLLAGPVTCVYFMPSGEPWEFTIYVGSASAYDQCIRMNDYHSGRTISVAGVKSAYLRVVSNDAPAACATDGVSTIEVTRAYIWKHSDDVQNWPEADAATLSALLVPIFAAAD
jgi:hypothetical protein